MKCKYETTGWYEGMKRCLGTKEVDPCPGYDKCKNYKPDYMTNADRIRSLSDEELYAVLRILACNDVCLNPSHDDVCTKCVFNSLCKLGFEDDILDWLKQPYGGAEG